MAYVDDEIKYKKDGRDTNRERSMKLVDPELAQMIRSSNYQMSPPSASAPDAIPMRPYKKGGAVKLHPLMKMMKEKRTCKAKGGPMHKGKGGMVEVDIISMHPNHGKMRPMDHEDGTKRMGDHEMHKGGRMRKATGGDVDIKIASMRPRKSEGDIENAGKRREAIRRKQDIAYDNKTLKESRSAFKEDMPHSKKEMMMHKDRLMRLEKEKHTNERGLKLDDREMRKGGEMKKSPKKRCYNMGGKAREPYAIGGAAKVRKGMETPSGQIKKVVKVHRPNYM
jgi:hypothetical protein